MGRSTWGGTRNKGGDLSQQKADGNGQSPAWQSVEAVAIYRAALAHRVSEDGKLILCLCAVF